MSVAFWDASAVVLLCADQRGAGMIRRLVRSARVVVWWGTPVEVASALARLRREALLTERDHERARSRLAAARSRWFEVTASDPVRELAMALPRKQGLRAADSFQLAAALVWCRERPRGRSFVCLDERLASAADGEGFAVVVPKA